MGDVVVHDQAKRLGEDITDTNIQQDVRVIERDLSGHCIPRKNATPNEHEPDKNTYTISSKKVDEPCMTPREIARFCMGAFILGYRTR